MLRIGVNAFSNETALTGGLPTYEVWMVDRHEGRGVPAEGIYLTKGGGDAPEPHRMLAPDWPYYNIRRLNRQLALLVAFFIHAIMDAMREGYHIGLNAHLLSLESSYRGAGAHVYIRHLLDHLPSADSSLLYTAFLGERRYRPPAALRLQVSRLPTARPPVRILWEQLLQPWALYRRGIDLLHAMAFVGPLASPCPFVVTIFDLSFLRCPETFRPGNRLYLRLLTQLSIRRARRIIAISEHTKADIIRWLGIPPERIEVIYCGVDEGFHPLPAEEVSAFRREKGLPERFFLHVGTLEPRKNLGLLLRAYDRLRAAGEDPPPLILAGGKGWMWERLFSQREELGLEDSVHFPGYVPFEELPLWYNAATCLLYPSLHEGFGLPPLESMACGTPVLSSNAASLPEVVGDAGLLLDPRDEELWAHELARVMSQPELRRELAERGLDRARRFTWGWAAEETVQTYRCALAGTANVQTLP
ncbi:MAG: glycosyltransferase family 1 protein [Chloroflexota bacterium]|nr:glycosyltransferase family 1 protein [Chloroflexota bacterium]